MRKLLRLLLGVGRILSAVLFLFFFACMAFTLFFGAPVSTIFETVDIVRMDQTSIGVVTNVEIDRSDSVTATRITYQFTVPNQVISSTRVFPGFLGNKGGYSGSSRLANEFPIGKRCVVYYDASCPTRCSLKQGWFCWSVGFTAVVWGGCFSKMRRKNLKIEILALVVQIYGAGLLFVGPLAVQLHEIHWHFFSLVVIGVSVTIYQLVARNLTVAEQPNSGIKVVVEV